MIQGEDAQEKTTSTAIRKGLLLLAA